MERITDLLDRAERPLIWAGYGIRLAGEIKRFREFVERAGIPFVTTWTAADIAPTDHPLNNGIVGVCGQRGANKTVAHADLIIVLGSHLSLPQTGPGFDYSKCAVVDIDEHELARIPSKVKVCAHLKDFFDATDNWPPVDQSDEWIMVTGDYAELNEPPAFGSYALNWAMTKMLPEGTCMVVDGGGTALYTGFQSSYIKEGSRLICSTAMSAMGSGLPEAIGACFANAKKLTTCIIGDGSLMLNVQELQTIATHRLPIKIFVINNGGYLAIRHTQRDFQDGRYYGVGGDDLQFPGLVRLAYAFNITYALGDRLDDILATEGPVLVEVPCKADQPMLRQGFKDGKPLPLTEMVIA